MGICKKRTGGTKSRRALDRWDEGAPPPAHCVCRTSNTVQLIIIGRRIMTDDNDGSLKFLVFIITIIIIVIITFIIIILIIIMMRGIRLAVPRYIFDGGIHHGRRNPLAEGWVALSALTITNTPPAQNVPQCQCTQCPEYQKITQYTKKSQNVAQYHRITSKQTKMPANQSNEKR